MATILNLPVELQTYILSFLTLYEHILASQVCLSWESILLDTQFQKTRYATLRVAEREKLFGIHGYFTDDIDDPRRFGIQVDGQGGKIVGYFFTHRNHSPEGFFEGIVETNISQSPFLDEPFFSPFVNLEAEGVDLADPALPSSQQGDSKLDEEEQIKRSALRAFIQMKEVLQVTVWVTTPEEITTCERGFEYFVAEQATVKQVIEGIWEKLWLMIPELVIEFVAPFQIDFDAAQAKNNAYMLVTLKNGVPRFGNWETLL
ncbi:hypothetical protein TWF281_009785 [Arthrobotrys megalospora]